MTAYVRHHTLRNGHSDAINCIAFSPSRLYLATGGDDNCIIIWRLEDHTFIYRLMFESPVDALLWLRIPAGSESLVGKDILFSGCRHGLISEASSFRLNDYNTAPINFGAVGPVHCLSYNDNHNLLAVGHGDEVHITKYHSQMSSSQSIIRLRFPEHLKSEGSDVRARDIHFLVGGDQVIVSYLHHGFICYASEGGELMWVFTPHENRPIIGRSALSMDGHQLLIQNLRGGIDIYAIDPSIKSRVHARHVRNVKYQFEETSNSQGNFPVCVGFTHRDEAIVSGSNKGNVCVWDVASGEICQVLEHNGHAMQYVAFCDKDNFTYIAAASSGKGQQPYIQIWRARQRPTAAVPALAFGQKFINDFTAAFHHDSDITDHDDKTHLLLAGLMSIILVAVFCHCIERPNMMLGLTDGLLSKLSKQVSIARSLVSIHGSSVARYGNSVARYGMHNFQCIGSVLLKYCAVSQITFVHFLSTTWSGVRLELRGICRIILQTLWDVLELNEPANSGALNRPALGGF